MFVDVSIEKEAKCRSSTGSIVRSWTMLEVSDVVGW